jgi:serine/threonine protein kinase
MTICGTDDWMAPEVILGMEYGQSADVFSFGIVLLEIISRTKVSAKFCSVFALSELTHISLVTSSRPVFFSFFLKDFSELAKNANGGICFESRKGQ